MTCYQVTIILSLLLPKQRLAYIGKDPVNRLAKQGNLGLFTKIDMLTCENCLARKITRKSFRKSERSEFTL